MGTSIYVYSNNKEYLSQYHRLDTEVMFSAPLLNMFLKPNKKLWIVTQITKHKERPQLGRSIVHFVNGTTQEYNEGDEVKLKLSEIKYNPKSGRVEFMPKKLRKAELEIRVDRFYGDKPKGKKTIDNLKSYYDISRDRLNFVIMKNESN